MKKFSLLLLMLLVGIGASWADTVTEVLTLAPKDGTFTKVDGTTFTIPSGTTETYAKSWSGTVSSIPVTITTGSDDNKITSFDSDGKRFQFEQNGTTKFTVSVPIGFKVTAYTFNCTYRSSSIGYSKFYKDANTYWTVNAAKNISGSNLTEGNKMTFWITQNTASTEVTTQAITANANGFTITLTYDIEALKSEAQTLYDKRGANGYPEESSTVSTELKSALDAATGTTAAMYYTLYQKVNAYKKAATPIIHGTTFGGFSGNDGEKFTTKTANTMFDNTSGWTDNTVLSVTGLAVQNGGGIKFNHSSNVDITYLYLDNSIAFHNSTAFEKGYINWSSTSGQYINMSNTKGAWIDVNSVITTANINIDDMDNGSIYLNEAGQLSLTSNTSLATTNKIYATLGNDFTDSRTLISGDFSTWTSQNLNTQVVITNNSKKVIVIEGTTDGLIVKAVSSITRSTTTNSYGTICLPYDATAEGAVVMAFTGRSANGLVFDFPDGTTEETATELTAGVPYLYRATADAQTFTTTGTTYTEAKVVKNFTGSYTDVDLSKTTDNTTYSYFLYTDDNMFHPAGEYVHLGAYKCYFPELPEITITSARENSVVFGIYGDATTGISTLNTSVDLNKDGKFIQNGRMVIVNNGKKYNAAGQIVK